MTSPKVALLSGVYCSYKHFYIELGSDIWDIIEWDECLPDCPQEEADPVCVDEPFLPRIVLEDDPDLNPNAVNFTTEFEADSVNPMLEFDFAAFECPEGFVFEGSSAYVAFAVCHDWQFIYTYDFDSPCVRKCIYIKRRSL